MSTQVIVAVFVFLGVIVSAVGTFMAVKRQRSGRIDTTEAGLLWQESTNMRHELRDQLVTEMARSEALELEVKRLEAEIAELRRGVIRNG